jgi:hypothetical protein
MKKKVWLIVFLVTIVLMILGCGGGGGGFGAAAILKGTVVLVGTGTRPDPAARVSSNGTTTNTSTADGTFTLNVIPNATTVSVEATGFPVFQFRLPALESGKTYELGELYIGPQQVVVRGRVLDALTNNPVTEATVTLQGDRTSTDTEGRFIFNKVAYDPDGAFDPEGLVSKSGGSRAYIPQPFVVDQPPISGEITLPDILMAPESSPNPPGQPKNVSGQVQVPVTETPVGTRIDIFTPPTATVSSRSIFVSDAAGQFGLWLPAGTHRLEFVKTRSGTTSLTASRTTTLSSASQQINLGVVELR